MLWWEEGIIYRGDPDRLLFAKSQGLVLRNSVLRSLKVEDDGLPGYYRLLRNSFSVCIIFHVYLLAEARRFRTWFSSSGGCVACFDLFENSAFVFLFILWLVCFLILSEVSHWIGSQRIPDVQTGKQLCRESQNECWIREYLPSLFSETNQEIMNFCAFFSGIRNEAEYNYFRFFC